MSSKVVAIIPARKGSKRLPEKNKKELCGKELIRWSIELALKIDFLKKIIVSTDDKDILDFCQEYEDPRYHYDKRFKLIKRPKEYAQDDTPIWKVIDHLFYSNLIDSEDIIILLQPTSPLRDKTDIHKALAMFLRNKEGVIPITKIDDTTYKRCGVVFVDWCCETFFNRDIREGQFILIPPERAIDINTLEDFQEAERLMKKRLGK